MASITTGDATAAAKSWLAAEADKKATEFRALQDNMEDFGLNTSWQRMADAYEAEAVALRS